VTTTIERIAILGGGSMGAGIAALMLGFGKHVVVVENEPRARETLPARVSRQLRHGRMMGGFATGARTGELVVTGDIAGIGGAGLVIEAVTEDAGAKRDVFQQATKVLPAGAVYVSNTSSIRITSLAGSVPRPENLIGVHFMNPPYLIQAVEVVRGAATSDRTFEITTRLLADVCRTPVVVRDGVGFVTSRLLHQMVNNAARIVEEGIADAESVDKIMESALGHPMGPLKIADLIGIDNLIDSITAQAEQGGDLFARPCQLLVDMARAGATGRKAGRGFYAY
jgi:methoxymalonate biosynthesis protein